MGNAAYSNIGAKHLYLLDFDPTNLPDLKATIESKYPDVKVFIDHWPWKINNTCH